MHYKYYVVIYFRCGKTLPLYSNNVSVHEGRNSSQRYLWVDGQEMAAFRKANPQTFREGEIILNDGSPLPKLYPKMPNDWDKEEACLRIIDKVIIDSKGRTLN